MYTGPENYSDSLTLIEVYKTDEENWEQYVPNTGSSDNKEDEEKKSDEETEEEDEEEELEETDNQGFTLHRGEIIETYYYGDPVELSFEYDYTDISDNGNLKFAEIKDLTRFYKGVRMLLRKKWRAPGETINADDLTNVLLCFITEETFNESGMELNLAGFTKVLEENYQFSFTQMKRSEILAEMIKTAGMTPVIDTTNLQDDVIDYTNVSSSGDSDDTGTVGGESGDINSFVKKAIKGKKGARAKAEAIHEALRKIIKYSYYSCSRYSSASECLQNASHLNCADTARLTRACFSAGGLTARVVHGPNHFWTEVQIDGQWVASDLTGCSGCTSRRSLGQVWNNYSKDRVCGDNPSC